MWAIRIKFACLIQTAPVAGDLTGSALALDVRHVAPHLSVRNCIYCERESSLVFHFARGPHEGADGGAGESSAHADAPDSGSSEFFDRIRGALQAHDDVDGLGNGDANLANGFTSDYGNATILARFGETPHDIEPPG